MKNARGEPIEGIMVQLIAGKNAVRTTVYSNADGKYEFPALDAGTYTLRVRAVGPGGADPTPATYRFTLLLRPRR